MHYHLLFNVELFEPGATGIHLVEVLRLYYVVSWLYLLLLVFVLRCGCFGWIHGGWWWALPSCRLPQLLLWALSWSTRAIAAWR